MDKIKKQFHVSLFSILSLMFVLSLSGCATSRPPGQNLGDYGNLSRPEKPFFSRHENDPQPDDPSLHKALPEMTSEDLEASGDRYFGNRDYYMAFVQYEKSLEIQPDNLRIHLKQGLLFLNTGKYEEAAKSFFTVAEKDPGNAFAYEGLGNAFFEMRKYGEAEAHFRKAVEIEPRLWKSRNFLGHIYDFQKKYDQASREYAEAIRLKPDEGLLYNNLGVSLSLAGRYEESIRAFKKALGTKGPKDRVYNNLGMVLAKTGRYDAALEAFRKGSNNAQAYNNLGCVYMSQGDYQKAAESFKKAIEVSPKFYAKANENLKKVEVGGLR
jgi:Flp pilus assembly protein TadD